MNILFVCTGNTCRSPMAEGILKQVAKEQGLSLEVQSAGVAAFPGTPISQHTQAILQARDINVDHGSQPVTLELVEWADLILTMTKVHKEMLCMKFQEATEKTYTLNEYADEAEKGDISDPFGGDLATYQETEKEIQYYVDRIIKKLSNH